MILITEMAIKKDLVGSKAVISVNMIYKSIFEYFFSDFRLRKELRSAHCGPIWGVMWSYLLKTT